MADETVTGRLRGAFSGRISPQRLAIASETDAMPGAFSAEELLRAVQAGTPGVGSATVYRALSAMAQAGFVEQVGVKDGAAVYARCRSGRHHHHLVCTSCGCVAEADCDVAPAAESASHASGFTVTRHEFNLYGLCAACAGRGKAG
jgi:Fur family ferric uptake transcriptional regulator